MLRMEFLMESNHLCLVPTDSNQEQVSNQVRSQYPRGLYFNPKDEELIVHYLKNRADNQPVEDVCIFDVDIYKFNPWELIEMYPTLARDDERYFYTSTERKYLNGSRPNRAAGDGYWKATVAAQRICYNNDCVGFKKTLVFFQGKAGKGKGQKKTNWIMHEYTLNRPPRPANDNMRLHDCVLCRIHERKHAAHKCLISRAEYETLEAIKHSLLDDFDLSVGHRPDDSQMDNQSINNFMQELIKDCM